MRLCDVVAGADTQRAPTERREATAHAGRVAPRPGATIVGDRATNITAVVADHRAVTTGALLACVRGRSVDGHAYAALGVAGGAAALLVDHELDLDIAQVVVPSVAEAAGPIAASFAGNPSRKLVVIGITGTNGKTTVSYLVESIAAAAGIPCGVIGTVSTRFGSTVRVPRVTTPDACALQTLLAEMRDAKTRAVAREVSSHALDQHRVDGTKFRVAAFTNLSQDHLDYHESMEAYFAAKARLFDADFAESVAINFDDPRGAALASRAHASGSDVWSYGFDAAAAAAMSVSATALKLGAHGSQFELGGVRVDGRHHIALALAGSFNVANALAAAASALAAGWSITAVVEGLAQLRAVPGRLERIAGSAEGSCVASTASGIGVEVFVDYAHTPDALACVLQTLREVVVGANGRVIVVFGCGGERDVKKRPLMGAAAVGGADIVIVTSDNPRGEDPQRIIDEILVGVADPNAVHVEVDRRAAIRGAVALARRGDVVLIAGKGHEPGQTAAGVTVPFDDRAEARAALAEQL